MSKRKREDDDDQDDRQSEKLRSRSRFRARFGKAVNDLTAALGLGRGFERQKLGRRQKQASSEPKTLLRLREEVIILKQLNLEKTAKNYLLKYLSKIKRIRESPVFVGVFGHEPKIEAVKPGAEANVLGRLFKSTPVKTALDDIVESMYKLLSLQQGTVPSTQYQAGAESGSKVKKQALPLSTAGLSEDVSEDGDFSDILEAYDNRLAQPDSDEEDADSFASFGSESIGGSTSASPIPEPSSASAFVPALGMTGYYSGSESDGSEIDSAEPKARKNRRGQRARQQIAELKYGKNAKHLQNSQSDRGRNAGWDAKRGAVGRSDRQHPRGMGIRNRNTEDQTRRDHLRRNDTVAQTEKPKTRDDAGSLHPSWQAAKQRKQQRGGQAAFAGKKVTFD